MKRSAIVIISGLPLSACSDPPPDCTVFPSENPCNKPHYNNHVNTMLFRPITYGQPVYSGVLESKKPVIMAVPSSFRPASVPIISRGGFGSSSIMSVGG